MTIEETPKGWYCPQADKWISQDLIDELFKAHNFPEWFEVSKNRKDWYPAEGDFYWYITSRHEIKNRKNLGKKIDKRLIEIGNYYPSHMAAYRVADGLEALHKFFMLGCQPSEYIDEIEKFLKCRTRDSYGTKNECQYNSMIETFCKAIRDIGKR